MIEKTHFLLVYTHQVTPRLKYVFKHISTRILGIEIGFTSDIQAFIAHEGMKMSYTKQPLGSEFFVKSHEILFEQGVNDIEINTHNWDDTKCFFYNGDKGVLPFDIFAAAFYLLSRYEEYLPHVKDEFGRFMATDSLAYKEAFLHQPVIDIWAYKFKNALESQYPEFVFPERSYSVRPVVDVPEAYQYKFKGLMRTLGGALKDVFNFRFKGFYTRVLVLLGFINDPYDTFKYIINRQKTSDFKFSFFFLVSDYSTFDKGINPNKKTFISLIKQVADYCLVGLKVSYFALEDKSILKKEKLRMDRILNTSLRVSRQSFSKLNLPESYRNLLELEILEDYTMGYVNQVGFRAGTCTPFLFYDIDYEIQTPLKIISYHIMDHALLKNLSLLDKKKFLNNIIQQVKQVNGEFVPVFHNYTFSSDPKWNGFKELFNMILDSANEN